MKKIMILALLCLTGASYGTTSEFFNNMDSNALKAGISKYIITKGGKISHGASYEANTFQGVEQVQTKHGTYTYNYIFNLVPEEGGTRLNLTVLESSYGSTPRNTDSVTEQKIMEGIKNSTKGRFLYGLGFEFDTYDSKNGKIKAPKGKDTGIKLTAVKYDALKKGLMPGDLIIEINDTPLVDIPIEEYATILHARTMTDTLTLTYKRNGEIHKVTLTPRLSNVKVF